MNTKEKKDLLAELIELNVKLGYEITHLIGISLLSFDFEVIKEVIEELKNELVNN